MDGLNWKRKLLFVSVPAVFLIGGGTVAASAATHQTGPPTTVTEPAAPAEPTEPAAAAGKPETSEPAGTVDNGHQDTGDQADHQFDGEE